MAGSSSSRLRFFQVTKKAAVFISRLRSQQGSSGKSYSTLPEELSVRQFSLADIKAATANFDEGLIIARGLHYLHTGTKYVVMHRNVTNTILLDHDWTPKLSGFFVSKLGPRSMSKALKRKEAPVEGAFGYLDP
ncbi:hypothetical protein F3Y22_tig00109992pilonHSYRG00080 [Hibiscus syriacus]|uniref:Protein kinase domain-containing protein n=1 Tax=Hibiscus syriacus TaxID=106335 RepID=A0A6A3BQR9_HIBSY|nr:hypothetical protein F3Y22_tig00109992pilonHSYRG00080 [Hibiscus syriacus]